MWKFIEKIWLLMHVRVRALVEMAVLLKKFMIELSVINS